MESNKWRGLSALSLGIALMFGLVSPPYAGATADAILFVALVLTSGAIGAAASSFGTHLADGAGASEAAGALVKSLAWPIAALASLIAGVVLALLLPRLGSVILCLASAAVGVLFSYLSERLFGK